MTKKILLIFVLFFHLKLFAQYNTATTGNSGHNPYANLAPRDIYGTNANQGSTKRNFFSNDVTVTNETPPTFDDNVPSTPIDGGIGILLAAGLGYGANKLRRRIKQSQ